MKRPSFLFAPGAGAPSTHPWIRHWAERLGTIGPVRTFDYDYMRSGRRRPDPLPQLIAAHCAALQEMRADDAELPVFLIGKSMGGRIGCHLALEAKVPALVCLGYPLCAGGDPAKMRDQVLRALRTPVLFVQGTRDSLCPLELLEPIRREMIAPNELFIIDGGDHSLAVPKRNAEPQEQVDARILRAIADFVARYV